ncbi:DEAD-box helicase domain-containing protein [Phanerochaete sordida]|uniref:ATP-dependent RNA helicase n=1 Tax=Phanerochaete sordida TaxID=48140 RepID=A0A9P3L845_9APHY|nr:DEAD-box helicase domain-containing protein [Phanerochaete sordida]
MNTMSASPSLNPASTPFFPGGGGFHKEDDGRGLAAALLRHNSRDTFGASTTSSFSISPSEYRSAKSSPSPSQSDGAEPRLDRQSEYHSPAELSRHSPANIAQMDAERGGFAVQRPVMRESSMSAILEVGPEGEETPGPLTVNGSYQHNTLYSSVMGRVRERLNTPPVNPEPSSRSSSFNSVQNNHIMSSSPASSLDSGSIFSTNVEFNANFDTHLRVSPAFHEVLDRLDKHERAIRDTYRALQDVNRKVDLLVERAFTQANSPPEFSNPFAGGNASSFSPPNLNGFSGPRGSIVGNIPPNQPAPGEDISVISHRLNSLSTSVDQLLAIQQHTQNGAVLTQSPQPNDLMNGRGMIPQAVMGLGVPGRTGPRLPGPPARTWSTGNLDIPMRASEQLAGPLGRADPGMRDKRRSVAGALLRRDSTATIDSVSTVSTRDGGPIISKWEQLPLHPDLLRSLTAFGVGPPNKIQQRALPFLLRGADIIAQAPPTQERIAAYVIPALHIAITNASLAPMSGPLVVMISTTVDQATQAHRMIRDLGSSIGVRSALGVGSTSGGNDLAQELRLLHQSMPHIICGTPQKLHALFTSSGGISGSEVRFLVLDEVDQLIARNLQDFVFNIVKLFPAPRTRPLNTTPTLPAVGSSPSMYSLLDGNSSSSSINPPFTNQRRFSAVASSPPTDMANGMQQVIDRQTALFSNTVPQDVLNLATAINLREPVRVLVRRDGNVTQSETSQGGRGLRQFYLYLAFTAGGGRTDVTLPQGGTGIIGSGRGTITSAETVQAREWKLDALADLLEDIDVPHVIVHVGGQMALDNVSYKLASRGLDVIPLNNDMNTGAKLGALNKFRNGTTGLMRQPATRVLVVYDVIIKAGDVPQVPLVVNYDLPKAVEEYAHRVNPAIATGYSRAGVVINFVTATGGDVEMLRSIECFYKIKCPEVPSSLRDIL